MARVVLVVAPSSQAASLTQVPTGVSDGTRDTLGAISYFSHSQLSPDSSAPLRAVRSEASIARSRVVSYIHIHHNAHSHFSLIVFRIIHT